MPSRHNYSLNKVLPRRQFLRGAAGVGLALPFLDAMAPRAAWAAPTPRRFFGFYIPNGLYEYDHLTGRPFGFFKPGPDPLKQFPLALEPIRPFWNETMIVSGLDNSAMTKSIENYPGGATVAPNHRTQVTSFMTCAPPLRDRQGKFLEMKLAQDSMDQVIARATGWGGKSLHVNLTSTTTHEAANSTITNERYSWILSFRDGAPVDMLTTPNEILKTFFVGSKGMKLDGLRSVYSQSHLDFMKESLASLKTRLGAVDRTLMADYLDQVRELELNASQVAHPTGPAVQCTAPAGGAFADEGPGTDLVAGKRYLDFARFAIKATVMGVRCDLLRTGAFSFGCEPSNMIYKDVIPKELVYPGADLSRRFHSDGIHGKKPEMLASIYRMQFSLIGELIKGLAEAKALDTTVLMAGSGFGQADAHQVPGGIRVLIGGRAFGLGGGRHIDAKDAEAASLYLAILRGMGCAQPSFGGGMGKSSSVLALA
jgi:hypothetical protein